jgi:hypothetical protein
LFFGLLRGKEGAPEWIDCMYATQIVFQKSAGAIRPPRGDDSRNGEYFSMRDYERARTRKEIIESE